MSVFKRSVRATVALLVGLSTATLLWPVIAAEVTYQYDQAGRLRGVVYPNSDQRNSRLDPAGNRLQDGVTVGGGFLQFAQSTYFVAENGGTLNIAVSRTGSTAGTVTIPYSAGGTATATSDYSLSGTLSWSAGDAASKNIVVSIVDDTGIEGNETLLLTLGTPTGAALRGTTTQVTVTIADNDASFSINDVSIGEAGGNAVFTVTKTGNPGIVQQLQYATSNGTATAGADYQSTSGTLDFAVGQATRTISVPITSDTTFDSNATFTGPLNETFTVTLTALTPGALLTRATGTATIIEDDPMPPRGAVQFTTNGLDVFENVGSVTFQVSRTGGSFGPASVVCRPLTLAGTDPGIDFDATPKTLSWTNGDSANKSCTVAIFDDSIIEEYCPDPPGDCPMYESFYLRLESPSGVALGPVPQQTASVVIRDNDFAAIPGNVRFTVSNTTVAETAGTVSYTITRTGASGPFGPASVQCVHRNGTAVAGSDFNAVSQTISWPAGDASNRSCSITMIDDSTNELTELFDIYMTNASGVAIYSFNDTINLAVTDDDPPPVAIPGPPFWTDCPNPPQGSCGWDTMQSTPVTAGLSWAPTGTAPVSYYELQFMDDGTHWNMQYSGPLTSNSTYLIFPDQSASFRVRACNASGCGLYGPIYSITVIAP